MHLASYIKRIAVAFLVLLALSVPAEAGKKKIGKLMNSWLGQTQAALVMEWGQPSSTHAVADGRKVLVYSWVTKSTRWTYAMNKGFGDGSYQAQPRPIPMRKFHIDKHGRIYGWRASTNGKKWFSQNDIKGTR